MRPCSFCSAFKSPRLGPYVKYTFESWFILFLTLELTKEDSRCALWNLCLGIFFDCWYPRDATEKGLQSKSLQPGRGAWPNATESTPYTFSKQGKEKRIVRLGRHTQCVVLRKCWVTDCYSDTETDATRHDINNNTKMWYNQLPCPVASVLTAEQLVVTWVGLSACNRKNMISILASYWCFCKNKKTNATLKLHLY